MLIDIHVHTAMYSLCSSIKLEDAVIKAIKMGLGCICVTDHESNKIADLAQIIAQKHTATSVKGVSRADTPFYNFITILLYLFIAGSVVVFILWPVAAVLITSIYQDGSI